MPLLKKNNTIPIPEKNRGGVTILVLAMLFAFIIIFSSVIQFISRQSNLTVNQGQEDQSFGLADTGVQYATWLLNSGDPESEIADFCDASMSPPRHPTDTLLAILRDHQVINETEVIGTFTVDSLEVNNAGISIRSTGKDSDRPDLCQVIEADIRKFSDNTYRVVDWDHEIAYGCDTATPFACVYNILTEPTGLIAHWRFDENSTVDPAVAIDSSSNGNHGQYTPSATPPTPDAINLPPETAAKFDNDRSLLFTRTSGNYVNAPNVNVPFGGLSIAAWIKQATNPSNGQSVAILNCTGGQIKLTLRNSNDKLVFERGGQTASQQSGTGIDLGWYHIVVTHDGTNVNYYLNGAADGTAVLSSTASATGCTIGYDSTNLNWDGNIDEVQIYNRVLTAGEINRLGVQHEDLWSLD